MSFRRGIAGLGVALGLAAGQHALAQRPIAPICSDNAADKLPPCKVAPDSQPQPAPGSVAPSAPAAKPTPAAGQFPFPGEDVPAPVLDPHEKVYDPKSGEDVPVAPKANANPGPDDSGSSSSSSSSGDIPDADDSPLKDAGSEGTTKAERRRLPKVEDMNAREEEDIKVAKFYHSTGNYLGAYLRAKDALKIDPDDAEAHLQMAINAQKLAKKDEAIAGYTTYLKLAPDGEDAKLAERGREALTK